MAADATCVLSSVQFEQLRRLFYRLCGIHLKAGKEELVRARLTKRLIVLGLADFDAYLTHIAQNPAERLHIVDALTTHKTSFFREPPHFDFLNQKVFPALFISEARVRLWSAGCSSGEEPYTLAMLLKEMQLDIHQEDVRILATDISTTMLRVAHEGIYDEQVLQDVPPLFVQRWFEPIKKTRTYRVKPGLKQLVRFARLNLIERWPMQGPFDVILCRNVMIYFDKAIQQWLAQRFYDLLNPGGYLIIGHSESLTGLSHEFEYVQPAVYVK